MGARDFAWADGLRRAHFPPERNVVPAHVTLFHHLMPSLEVELKERLRRETRGVAAPRATVAGLMNLGRGVAFRIESPELGEVRERLADAFRGMLVPQDAGGWRPHITVQNKVEPGEAKRLHAALSEDFTPRPLAIAGLAAWWYRGGPWEAIGEWKFKPLSAP